MPDATAILAGMKAVCEAAKAIPADARADFTQNLAAHDAGVARKAKALEGYLGYLDQGSGSELAWPELRRRIAALKAEGGQ